MTQEKEDRRHPPLGWAVRPNKTTASDVWDFSGPDCAGWEVGRAAAIAACWSYYDKAKEEQLAPTTGERPAPKRDLSVVDAFAEVMREKLRQNDHKGHWSKEPTSFLIGKLREEVAELIHEVTRRDIDPRLVAREAADVAAVAMMLADNAGGLGKPEPANAALESSPARGRCFGVGRRRERCVMYAGHAGSCQDEGVSGTLGVSCPGAVGIPSAEGERAAEETVKKMRETVASDFTGAHWDEPVCMAIGYHPNLICDRERGHADQHSIGTGDQRTSWPADYGMHSRDELLAIEALRAAYSRVPTDSFDMEPEIERLRKTVEALAAENDRLRGIGAQGVQNQTRRAAELTNENETLRVENERLHKTLTVVNIEKTHDENDRLSADNERLLGECNQWIARNQELEARLARIRATTDGRDERPAVAACGLTENGWMCVRPVGHSGDHETFSGGRWRQRT